MSMKPGDFFNQVEYAERCGIHLPADAERDGFGWRLIPRGSAFWTHWKAHKIRMRAEGFRIAKRDDGSWMVSRLSLIARR